MTTDTQLPIPHAKTTAAEAVDVLLEMMNDAANAHPDHKADVARIFWDTVRAEIDVLVPRSEPNQLPSVRAMTDQQARDFEAERMPFGKHDNKVIGDVPPEYLLWLDENSFNARLRQYLASERFQRRQEG